jgi:hypothetical protein
MKHEAVRKLYEIPPNADVLFVLPLRWLNSLFKLKLTGFHLILVKKRCV